MVRIVFFRSNPTPEITSSDRTASPYDIEDTFQKRGQLDIPYMAKEYCWMKCIRVNPIDYSPDIARSNIYQRVRKTGRDRGN